MHLLLYLTVLPPMFLTLDLLLLLLYLLYIDTQGIGKLTVGMARDCKNQTRRFMRANLGMGRGMVLEHSRSLRMLF